MLMEVKHAVHFPLGEDTVSLWGYVLAHTRDWPGAICIVMLFTCLRILIGPVWELFHLLWMDWYWFRINEKNTKTKKWIKTGIRVIEP
jgi:hypothetical protein